MKVAHMLAVTLAVPLSGCWFIFVPGSVTGALSDAITGDEGAHCVPEYAKVGDRVPLPGNGRGTIKSLSGKSYRCSNPEQPVRALIIPDPPR